MHLVDFVNNGKRFIDVINAIDAHLPFYLMDDSKSPYLVQDGNIFFHPQNDIHHLNVHIRREDVLLLKDLLYVTDNYLSALPYIYEKKVIGALSEYPTKEGMLQKLREPIVEKDIYFLYATSVLKEHYQQKQATFDEDIAQLYQDFLTENLQQLGYSQQESQKLLGQRSPYVRQLLCEEFTVYDTTGFTVRQQTPHHIPIYTGQEPSKKLMNDSFIKINTPDFSMSIEKNIMRQQINLFLPARYELERYYEEEYSFARCLLDDKNR